MDLIIIRSTQDSHLTCADLRTVAISDVRFADVLVGKHGLLAEVVSGPQACACCADVSVGMRVLGSPDVATWTLRGDRQVSLYVAGAERTRGGWDLPLHVLADEAAAASMARG